VFHRPWIRREGGARSARSQGGAVARAMRHTGGEAADDATAGDDEREQSFGSEPADMKRHKL